MPERPFSLVASSVWYSEKFAAIGPLARLGFLWIVTTERGNSTGVFRFGLDAVPATVCAKRQRRKMLDDLTRIDLIRWDEPREILSITNYFKRCPIMSWQHATAAINTLTALGRSPLTQARAEEIFKQDGFAILQQRENARSQAALMRFFRAFHDPE